MKTLRLSLSLIAAVLWSSGGFPAQAAVSPLTPVVLGPRESLAHSPDHTVAHVPTTAEFESLLDHPEQWVNLRKYVGAILYTDHGLKSASDADLKKWMSQMRALNLTLEIESGVIKRWSASGAASFKKDSAVWDRIIQAGGVISAIAMDEPLPAAENQVKPPLTDDQALDQIAIYVALVHQHYPDIEVGLINAYPHFTPEQAIADVDGLQARLKQKGVRGLDFYRMDPNWIAFVKGAQPGSWDGMKQIEQECNSVGLPFSLIYWAANYPADVKSHDGVQDDHFWSQGLLQESAGFAGTGAHPDQIVIESWVGAPARTLPETDPLTLTGSSLGLLQKYSGPPTR